MLERIASCATIVILSAALASVAISELTPPLEAPATHEGDHRFLLIDDVAYAIATPCPTEDSPDCYWDASLMGNGTGSSFVNVGGNILPVLEGDN